jgi:hypothetical protein
MSAQGQTFTFRRLNKRRLSNAEADQALTYQECQKLSLTIHVIAGCQAIGGIQDRRLVFVEAHRQPEVPFCVWRFIAAGLSWSEPV